MMDAEERQQHTHGLELAYREASHQVDLAVRDEEARRLQLRSVLLEGDTTDLRLDADRNNAKLNDLKDDLAKAMKEAEDALRKRQAQERVFRSQASQLELLKTEMQSMTTASEDSAKLFAEKLALTRQVAMMQPEIDHLRAEAVTQQDTLAEKLRLERQVTTLEVELTNERTLKEKALTRREVNDDEAASELCGQVSDLDKRFRAEKRAHEKTKADAEARRAEITDLQEHMNDLEVQVTEAKRTAQRTQKANSAKSSSQDETEAELRARLAELEKELEKAEQAAKKANSTGDGLDKKLQQELEKLRSQVKEQEQTTGSAQRAQQDGADTAAARIAELEKKHNDMKAKLREARVELKDMQAKLDKARVPPSMADTAFAEEDEVIKPTAKAQARRKKKGTTAVSVVKASKGSGSAEEKAKGPARKPLTAVGEKSNFSITPLLNKTQELEISDDSIDPSAETSIRHRIGMVQDAAKAADSPTPVAKKARGRPKAAALAEAPTSRTNIPPMSARKRLSQAQDEITANLDKSSQQQENAAVTKPVAKAAEPAKATKSTALDPSELPTLSRASEQPEPKRKRRKLLGANPNSTSIFDDDENDPEAIRPVAAVKRPGTSSGQTRLTGGSAAAAAPGLKRAPVVNLGKRNAFAGAAFSPLKKDRRGVNASFLG